MTVSEEGLALLTLARRGGDVHFTPATGLCLIVRDTCWYAIALLFDEDKSRRDLGNRILASLRSEDGTHTPASMIALLKSAPVALDRTAAESLRHQIKEQLPAAAETEWKDGNVNHPLGAYCTLVCGGEMAGEAWAPELGARRLRRMLDRIGEHRSVKYRQAEMSEYNSLTYTALSLCFLALIAEYAVHAEARLLALRLEQGLWTDVAMHFHPPSQQFAGPHSRSYHEDSIGGFSALHGVWMAAGLGDLFINPDLSIRFEHPSDLLQNALTAVVPFHLPAMARTIAWQKPFPYLFRKTTYAESYHENSRRAVFPAESGISSGDNPRPFAFDEEVYPGGWTDLTTYMTHEYALGSAARPYVNAGHSDAVMLRIRRSDAIRGMADFRSIYTRGVYNGALPGRRNFCHTASSDIDASYLYEEGRSLTYQHENTVIVCYSPKRAGHRGVTSFRLDITLTDYAPLDDIFVDGSPVRSLPISTGATSRICLRDFRTYILLLPLFPAPAAGRSPVLIRRVGEFLLLSIVNYEGEDRDFTRDEMSQWRSGFVMEVHTADEFKEWTEFLAYAEKATVLEECNPRGVRTVVYQSGGHRMEFRADPFREEILTREWDGTDDSIDHFHVLAAGEMTGPFCPRSLFGKEAAG